MMMPAMWHSIPITMWKVLPQNYIQDPRLVRTPFSPRLKYKEIGLS